MKTKLLFLVVVLQFQIAKIDAQWVAQTAPTGTTSLYSVYAISSSSVACAGATRVIRTLDGGVTWTSPLTVGGTNIYTVHSGSSSYWHSLTFNSTWMMKVGNPGGITLTSGKPDSIMALHFNTPGCATAVGGNGKIVTTCDTGATWQLRAGGILTFNSVWYADATVGIACGVFGGMKRTTDGGATWSTITSGATQNFNGVTFANSMIGYAVGNVGTMLKTIDGGLTWTALTLGITNNINGVYFVSPTIGYIVGSGGMIKTTIDGGITWSTMTSGTAVTLRSVHFTNPTAGWVCGDGATILKYCPTLSVTGSISGTTTVCAGDTLTYSIAPVTGATGYSWTAPAGWSGGSTTTTMTCVAGYTSGNITVAATNSCGNGVPATLAITNNSPPQPTITQATTTLTSSSPTGNQWYLNGVLISGATTQTISYSQNGTYTVVVTANGCSSTSLPLVVTNAGIDELQNGQLILSPNPCSIQLVISSLNALAGSYESKINSISIYNELGELVLTPLCSQNGKNQYVIDVSCLKTGMYFIAASSLSGIVREKFIKD